MSPQAQLLSLPDHQLGRITITQADLQDYRYIDALQKKHVNRTGFVPKTAIQNHLERQSYILLRINGQPTGYMMSAGGIRKPHRLIQVAIESEAWRTGLGTLLIGIALAKAGRKPKRGMTATVRAGLPMNPTVQATGAEISGYDLTKKARGKPLIHYLWNDSQTHPNCSTRRAHHDERHEHNTYPDPQRLLWTPFQSETAG